MEFVPQKSQLPLLTHIHGRDRDVPREEALEQLHPRLVADLGIVDVPDSRWELLLTAGPTWPAAGTEQRRGMGRVGKRWHQFQEMGKRGEKKGKPEFHLPISELHPQLPKAGTNPKPLARELGSKGIQEPGIN